MIAPSAQRIRVSGRVQGVGFRPFVYRLAHEFGILGWVRNAGEQVEIHAEAREDALADFVRRLKAAPPPLSLVAQVMVSEAPAENAADFRILESNGEEAEPPHVPTDHFLCPDCVKEILNGRERRYHYPFINCTQCGPRYTVIKRFPYDRPNTTLAAFDLCAQCREEYENPLDRRFHAQPMACPRCGPHLTYVDRDIRVDDDSGAIGAAIQALRDGKILGLKGVGGYHLCVDARNERAIARLRLKKPRPQKPLAVMLPQDDAAVRQQVDVSDEELAFLNGSSRPILLARRGYLSSVSGGVAPGVADLGVMLPSSPLHFLLMKGYGQPVVATSANIGGEPVYTEEEMVVPRLNHMVDAWLHHDRPIARPADDGVYRYIAGRPRAVRLGRGAAPLEIDLPFELAAPVLAVGGQQKNTLALGWGRRVVVSPHIGDMDARRSIAVLEQLVRDLSELYGVRPEAVICDHHAGYATHQWALRQGLPVVKVWHHHAHASALAGEYPEVGRWLTFAWDGFGLGPDGTLWGGEAFLGSPGRWRRIASFRPYRLVGGDRIAREPWRSGVALAHERGLSWRPGGMDVDMVVEALERNVHCIATTSVGRLFDAAAAYARICVEASFDGQAAMYLEAAAKDGEPVGLPLARDGQGVWRADWGPLVEALVAGGGNGEKAGLFHASLARSLVEQAVAICAEHGARVVGLCGGVFQNRRLVEQVDAELRQRGFEVRLPARLPSNDGGLSFGQVIEAGAG